jgi:hypothetical protein
VINGAQNILRTYTWKKSEKIGFIRRIEIPIPYSTRSPTLIKWPISDSSRNFNRISGWETLVYLNYNTKILTLQAALIIRGFAIRGFDYSRFINCSQNLLFVDFPRLFAVFNLKLIKIFKITKYSDHIFDLIFFID